MTAIDQCRDAGQHGKPALDPKLPEIGNDALDLLRHWFDQLPAIGLFGRAARQRSLCENDRRSRARA